MSERLNSTELSWILRLLIDDGKVKYREGKGKYLTYPSMVLLTNTNSTHEAKIIVILTKQRGGGAVEIKIKVYVCIKILYTYITLYRASQVAVVVKNLSASAEGIRDEDSIPGWGRFPGVGHGNSTPVFLPGESPWTEEPGRLQFIGS